MSNSVQHKISLVRETTFGTTPTSPVMEEVRITGTTLALSKGVIESEAIRSDRQIEDVRPGNRQIGGELAFELPYGGLDKLLEAVLCGTWTPRLTVTGTNISAASGDNSINSASAAFPIFTVGEKILIAGFTGTVGNNGYAHVVSRTASKIVISGITLVTDAAGESVTVSSETMTLKPGTTRRSHSVLRQFTDLDGSKNPFHLYSGVEFNTLSIELKPEAIVKGSLAVWGRALAFDTAAPAGTTYADPSSNKPFDSFNGSVEVNDVDRGTVTELKLTIENGLEPRFVCFDDKSLQPKLGRTKVSGTVTTYFEDSADIIAFSASTRRKLKFDLVDENGNTLSFVMPSIMQTGAQADVSGEADVHIPIPFHAVYDSTATHALQITRTPI